MTIRDAQTKLGVSRETVQAFIRAGVLSSELELHNGRARRLIRSADVERLLSERLRAAAEQTGKGRPIKLPKLPD